MRNSSKDRGNSAYPPQILPRSIQNTQNNQRLILANKKQNLQKFHNHMKITPCNSNLIVCRRCAYDHWHVTRCFHQKYPILRKKAKKDENLWVEKNRRKSIKKVRNSLHAFSTDKGGKADRPKRVKFRGPRSKWPLACEIFQKFQV